MLDIDLETLFEILAFLFHSWSLLFKQKCGPNDWGLEFWWSACYPYIYSNDLGSNPAEGHSFFGKMRPVYLHYL